MEPFPQPQTIEKHLKKSAIPGYPEYNLLSNGSIWSKRKKCFLKTVNHRGYKNVGLYNEEKKETCRVNRLVAQAFIPNPLNLPEVNHLDGDKSNNNDWNLEWCTHAENMEHAGNHGLMFKKLNKRQMLLLKIEYQNSKITQKELALKYGVSQSRINTIINDVRI